MKTKLLTIFAFLIYLTLFTQGNTKSVIAQGPDEWEVVAQIPTVPFALGIDISADNSTVYVVGRGGAIEALDAATFAVKASTVLPVSSPGGDSLSDATLTPDQRYLIVGDEHGDAYFLDPITLATIRVIDHGSLGPHLDIAVTSDSQIAVSSAVGGSSGGKVYFYDLSVDPSVLAPTFSEKGNPWDLALTPDQTQVYVAISQNGAGITNLIRVIDVASHQAVAAINTSGDVRPILMDPVRNLAYAGSVTGMSVINVNTASEVDFLPSLAHTGPSDYDASTDTIIAGASEPDGTLSVRIISAATLQLVQSVPILNEGGVIGKPKLSPDGKRIYIASMSHNTLYVLEHINQPPSANAGGPYTGDEGSAIALDGSGSSDDQGIMLYEWDCTNDGTYDVSSANATGDICTYPDNGLFTVKLRVTDTAGATDEATASVTVSNMAPTLTLSGNSNVDEGSPYTLNISAVTDPGADIISNCTVDWGDSNSDNCTPGSSLTHTYADGDSNYTVSVELTDEDGTYLDVDPLGVMVHNVAPALTLSGNSNVDEGSSYTLNISAVTDPGADTISNCTVDWGDSNSDGCTPGSSLTHTYADGDNSYTISVDLTDEDGTYLDVDTLDMMVDNVAPTVGDIVAPVNPVQVGTNVEANANFQDPGVLDSHTALWDWGDGTTSAGSITETAGSGSVTGSHTYETPGVYLVSVNVTDNDGAFASATATEFIVVYDPEGGFVTGGGWINSPEGAYRLEPSLTGKATFGFVSKYKKGANVPTGQTEFQFKAGNLNFHSSTYDWLVVAGPKAMFKGVGTINGVGNYGFMVSAIDEKLTPSTDVDLFRIKIWDKDNGDAIVYDNQMGADDDADPMTAIGGGSIVIHNK